MDLEMNQFKRRYDENFTTFALLNVHSFTYTRKIIYSISKSSRFITRIWFFQTGLASQLARAIYCVPQACYQIREVDRDEREVEVRVLRLENERRLYKALYIPRNSSFNVSVSPLLSQIFRICFERIVIVRFRVQRCRWVWESVWNGRNEGATLDSFELIVRVKLNFPPQQPAGLSLR